MSLLVSPGGSITVFVDTFWMIFLAFIWVLPPKIAALHTVGGVPRVDPFRDKDNRGARTLRVGRTIILRVHLRVYDVNGAYTLHFTTCVIIAEIAP